jgi:hypothetical protein
MSDIELKNASNYFGFDISKRNIKQQKMLVSIYHYREGWIDEDKLEQELSKIFKPKQR